jgi:hypothetical protein
LALDIYNVISNSNSSELRFASGILLFYLGRKKPDLIIKEINDNRTNSDLAKRSALIMSLQDVPPWRNDTNLIPQSVKDFVVESSGLDDERLKRLTAKTAIIRYDLDKSRFRPIIESFVDESDINKIIVCQVLEPDNCPDTDFDLLLIKRCSNTNSIGVIEWLIRIMGGKLLLSKIDKQELAVHALAMLRKWSSIPRFSHVDTQFLIEGIGGIDIERAMDFIERWISEENSETIMISVIPNIIYQLYHDKEIALFDRISSWLNRGEKFSKMWFLTIKKILDEIYHFTNHKFN